MITLEPGEVFCVSEAAGTTVTAHSGRLWVTEQGDGRDVMLRPGERHTIRRGGLTVVEAFDPSVVSLREPWTSSS